jgi:hypothetical protein
MAEKQPRKLEEFDPLTKAEQQVLDELDTGEVIRLGDGKLPSEDAGPERQLRARFVRWLALGRDDAPRLHEKGLRVQGALITSDGPAGAETRGLDLEGCEIARDLMFFFCRFMDPPLLRRARVQSLFLISSVLPGLSADGLETRDDVTLRGAEVTGEVRLLGAQIGGDLDCVGTKITNAGGRALSADRAKFTGTLFLRGAEVTGEVRLVGARIGGNLDCVGAKITNADGKALNAGGAKVTGSFYLRQGAKIDGALDLTAAELGAINDEPACWPKKPGNLLLDRCRYGAFTGFGISAADRIRWLALQDPAKYGREFAPSAYEKCAKVFRDMGHLADAKKILIEKEKLQRADRLKRIGNPLVKAATWLVDRLLGATVRYWQKPLFALWWLLGFWLFGMVVFQYAWQEDAFKPNNAVVLRADEWVGCSVNAKPYAFRKDTATASQLGCFLAQPEAEGFPKFDVLVYALDVLLPLVQLEQQVHWVPDEDIRPIGRRAKWLVYIEIVAGWVLSLLVVAGLSGLIKSD